MGRPKGSRDKVKSDKRIVANRANGMKPKLKLDADARQELTDAKNKLGRALARFGIGHVAEIIEQGPKHPLFEWGMNFAADRGGLPRRTEADVTDTKKFEITVVDAAGGAHGWPAMVEAVPASLGAGGDEPGADAGGQQH